MSLCIAGDDKNDGDNMTKGERDDRECGLTATSWGVEPLTVETSSSTSATMDLRELLLVLASCVGFVIVSE